MSGDREELIRQRAYALWERDGGAHGRHEDHWAQATREVDDEAAKTTKRAGRTKAAKIPDEKAPAKASPPRAKATTKAPAPAKVKPARAVSKAAASAPHGKHKGD
jgi:hypothetical protein